MFIGSSDEFTHYKRYYLTFELSDMFIWTIQNFHSCLFAAFTKMMEVVFMDLMYLDRVFQAIIGELCFFLSPGIKYNKMLFILVTHFVLHALQLTKLEMLSNLPV